MSLVAEALRSRFPLSESGARRRPVPVAEALHSRFPPAPRTPAEAGPAFPEVPGPTLPRRIRNLSVSARPAQPASPELLLRILDGLQRL